MKQKKLLTMLVLLAAVATGAVAQTTINVTADDLGKAVCTDGSIYDNVYKAQSAGKTAAAKIICLDTQNSKALALSLDNQAVTPGTVDYATAQSRCEALNTTLAVTFGTWVLPSKAQWEAMIEAAGGYKKLRDGIGTLFGGKKMEAVIYWSSTAGTTGHWRFNFNDGDWDENTYESSARACLVINLPQTYSVTLAEGTEDEGNWTIEPKEATAGSPVTATYKGEKKVKSVKAVKKAPAATPLDNTIKAWTAGSYAVPAGGLTYSDAVTVSGDVTLTLTDGETLTLNKGISLAEGATLTVEGNGTMNVNGTNDNSSSTVAGSGMMCFKSGTLVATGGNGHVGNDLGQYGMNGGISHGGSAINGSLTLEGGNVTATGGNGGNAGGANNINMATGGNGGSAITGNVIINGGNWTANNGSNGTLLPGGSYNVAGTGGKAVAGTVTDNR